MLTLMTLRCEQCGHENDSRYRFCGMCGAKLPLPVRENAASRTDPAAPEPSARRVSGPSFLGLADEPSDPVSYLLEDETTTRNWGRSVVVLVVFLGCIAAASWHWRHALHFLVLRTLGGPTPQSQQTTDLAPAPAASSAETQAPPSATPAVTPPQAATAKTPTTTPNAPSNSTTPTAQNESAAGDQPPTGATSTPSSAVSNSPSPVAGAQPAQPAEAASGDNSQPANSDSKDEAGAKNAVVASSETPAIKPAPAAKTSKSSGDQLPEGSESDALEAQGEKYLYGNGVPANCALAQKSLVAAAERSNAKAQSVLGTMYATGHCATRDLPLAYRWFARALRQDPNNLRIEQDLKVLWSQMSADERQLALRAAR